MKILHISDLHLSKLQDLNNLTEIIDKTKDEVEVIFITGDLFHSRLDNKYSTKNLLSKLSEILINSNKQFFITRGNSDNICKTNQPGIAIYEDCVTIEYKGYRFLLSNSGKEVYEIPSKDYDIAFTGTDHEILDLDRKLVCQLTKNLILSVEPYSYTYCDKNCSEGYLENKKKYIKYNCNYNVYFLDFDNNKVEIDRRVLNES